MQCPICKAEWSLSKSKSQQLITKCPFCGENLSIANYNEAKDGTIVSVLQSLVKNYGEELYAENSSPRFKALLSDVAVNFQREQKLLKLAVSENIPARLLACTGKSDDDKQNVMFYCKKKLVEEYSILEETAIDIINILSAGLGWHTRIKESQIENQNNEIPFEPVYSNSYLDLTFPKQSLLLAAFHGDIGAQEEVADIYRWGRYGVDQSPDKAVEWYKKVAEAESKYARGDTAKTNIGEIYYEQKKYDLAFEWLSKADTSSAQSLLGQMYFFGTGVQKNYDLALKYLLMASDFDVIAQELLGHMYYYGEGVQQDYKKAADWFTKTGILNPEGQWLLGGMYAQGKGVSQNLVLAVECWTHAAFAGINEAVQTLRSIHQYLQGKNVPEGNDVYQLKRQLEEVINDLPED